MCLRGASTSIFVFFNFRSSRKQRPRSLGSSRNMSKPSTTWTSSCPITLVSYRNWKIWTRSWPSWTRSKKRRSLHRSSTKQNSAKSLKSGRRFSVLNWQRLVKKLNTTARSWTRTSRSWMTRSSHRPRKSMNSSSNWLLRRWNLKIVPFN